MKNLPIAALSALLMFGVHALGADWLTDGGDTKRNNWQKDEKLLTIANVNGALIGGASLKAEEFLGIAAVYRTA